MSVSQFWLLVIGVQASTSRMPYLSKEQVWNGSPSRSCGTCESVGTTAESHSGRMASPRSWTSLVRSPDSVETADSVGIWSPWRQPDGNSTSRGHDSDAVGGEDRRCPEGGHCGDALVNRALRRHAEQVSLRKGWQDAVREVAGIAAQWIYGGVWVAGDAEGYGQGKRRCDAGALGGRHVAGKAT